jgi:hypothetical protein
LGLVDDALKAAVDAGKRTSIEADAKFREAIESLKGYEEDYYYPNKPADVEARMKQAKANDKSSLAALNRLIETFIVRQELVPLLGRILIPISSQWRQCRRKT